MSRTTFMIFLLKSARVIPNPSLDTFTFVHASFQISPRSSGIRALKATLELNWGDSDWIELFVVSWDPAYDQPQSGSNVRREPLEAAGPL